MSLVTAPLWGLAPNQIVSNAPWISLANPLLLAATSAVIVWTALIVGWRRSTAVLCGFLFGFGTMAAPYSQTLFSESGVALGAALALLGYVAWWRGEVRAGAWLLGAGVAVAVLFRPDSAVLIGLMAACIIFVSAPRRLWETRATWLPAMGTPIAIVAVWTLLYNGIRYGSVLDFGYAGPYSTKGFSTPLIDGVGLQLWSPGKSFFLYSPILVLAIPGLVLMWRRQRPVGAMIILVCVARVLFYARWFATVGGASWGPRFLLPLCVLLILPVGAVIERLHGQATIRKNVGILLVTVLALCTVAVQAAAVVTDWKIIEHHAGAGAWRPSRPTGQGRRRAGSSTGMDI